MRNPAYHYGRWGGVQPAAIAVPVYAPVRMSPRRPILSRLKAALGIPPSASSSAFRCWGPAWDRTCKVCAPLPSGGETCSSFKVNDTQGAPTERIGFYYGRPR